MNNRDIIGTVTGFAVGTLFGESTQYLSHQFPHATITQEKIQAIALAFLGSCAIYGEIFLLEEAVPYFSGFAFGLTIELLSSALRNKDEFRYANIGIISAIFAFHLDNKAALMMIPTLLPLGATILYKQFQIDQMRNEVPEPNRFLLEVLDVADELSGELGEDPNPMLCGNPPRIPLDPVLKPNDRSRVYDRKCMEDADDLIPLKKYKKFVDDCIEFKNIDMDLMRAAIDEFKDYNQSPLARRRSSSRTRKKNR